MFDNLQITNELELNYGRIKDIISRIKFTSDNVDKLVNEFSELFNSRRKQSTVSNVTDLISLLEERCELDCIKMELLFTIESEANDEVLKTAISCHQKLLRRWYSERSELELINEPEVTESFNSLRVEIPKPVMDILCQGIGYSWRDFARCLNLTEKEIDQIDETYNEDSERVKWVLISFEETPVFFTYKDIILKGLMKIRRYDLKDRVNEIFSKVSPLS